jgi:peroxiredoxin
MRGHKLAISSGVFALMLACGAEVGGGERLQLGSMAPMSDVKMKGVNGRERSISDAKGENGTLVIFSCNACPWVVAWEDRITEIGNAYQKVGFGVIVINANDPQRVPEDGFEAMVKRSKERGFAFPYLVDATSDVARAFGATRTPEVFLFDKQGLLVYHGAIDDNARESESVEIHYLKDALEAVLQGKDVGRRETKALGCSIKFRPKT